MSQPSLSAFTWSLSANTIMSKLTLDSVKLQQALKDVLLRPTDLSAALKIDKFP